MTAISKTDILFDDVSMIKQLFGQAGVKASAPNSNCDCVGYVTTADDEDTDQIAPSSDKAN